MKVFSSPPTAPLATIAWQRILVSGKTATLDAILPGNNPAAYPLPDARLVAIGASTGGPEAIRRILRGLSVDACGVVIVQHIPELFSETFVRFLDQECPLQVRMAADGDPVVRGQALIAPNDRHLVVVRRGNGYAVEVIDGPLVGRHRPSIDVLFRSVGRAAGPRAVGVILSGMGDDGAVGLGEMKRSGAATLAQDESSCVVFGMPREALARGAVDKVVPLSEMASVIEQRLRPTAADPTFPAQLAH